MVDWRENLNWIVGSITATIGGVLAYLQEYEFLGTLLGTVIGAGIAYFVQGRTQKRTWKREYSIKIVEEVYGALYSSIVRIIRNLEEKSYNGLDFSVWTGFQAHYRYLMVDEEFRNNLDSFLDAVKKYTKACLQLRNKVLPDILKHAIKEVFDFEADSKPEFSIKYSKNKRFFSHTPILLEKLRNRYSLSAIVDEALQHEDASRISNISISVNVRNVGGSGMSGTFSSHELIKVEKFWELCLKKMAENDTYMFIVKENEKLLKDAKNIKKELIKRIQEPWKI